MVGMPTRKANSVAAERLRVPNSIAAKIVAHYLEWEILSVNPLFSGIVASNVFLMGFLLSGVLSDFKESERLPGELAAALENLAQEIRGIGMANTDAHVEPCLLQVRQLGANILDWFHKRQRTAQLLEQLNELTPQFAILDKWTQATLLARPSSQIGRVWSKLLQP